MATEPMTETQRLFLTFLFGFAGSMLANFILKQTQAPPVQEYSPYIRVGEEGVEDLEE